MGALEFFAGAIAVLWIALAIAVGVLVLAALWLVAGAVTRRLEGRFLPAIARWSHRRAGLADGAGPWACPACHSVSAPTGERCYHCGLPRPVDAPELAAVGADPTVFHPAPAPNRFDPSIDLRGANERTDGAPRDARSRPGAHDFRRGGSRRRRFRSPHAGARPNPSLSGDRRRPFVRGRKEGGGGPGSRAGGMPGG